ncbi:MAG: signal peptide peptidase SppA [Candidatus Woesearchaeota archaeon]
MKQAIIIAAGVLLAIVIAATFISVPESTSTKTVAVIPITNVLVTQSQSGLFSSASVSSQQIINWLEKANDDKRVAAILLHINSPGGSAVASDEIAQAIKELDKPVVAWIRESGASGAYWIASEADHIIANRMSITGSVGVTASYIGFAEFFEEHNITYEQFTAGEHKELATPFSELTEEQRTILQSKLDAIHDIFLEEVRANRNLTQQQFLRVRTGEFFLGLEALELGLVDELGSQAVVKKRLEELLEAEVRYDHYATRKTFMEELLGVRSPNQLRIEAR